MGLHETGGRFESKGPREQAIKKLQYFMMAASAAAALTFPIEAQAQTVSTDRDPLALDVGDIDAPPTPPRAPEVRPERPPVNVRTVEHTVSAQELDRARELALATLPNITGPDNAYTRSHAPTYRQALAIGQRSVAPQMNRVTESIQLQNLVLPGGSAARVLEGSTMYFGFEGRGVVYQEARAQIDRDGFAVPNVPTTLSDAQQREVVSGYRLSTILNNPDFVTAPLSARFTGAPANSEHPNHVTASHTAPTADEAVFGALADIMRNNTPTIRDRVNYMAGDQMRGALTFAIQRSQSEIILGGIHVRLDQVQGGTRATVSADAFVPMVVTPPGQ